MPTPRRSIREMPDGRFVVRYRYGQKSRRKKFATREQAVDFVKAECRRLAAFGQMAVELTGSQLGRIVALAEELAADAGEGARLSEGIVRLEKVVQFWKKNRKAFAAGERAASMTLAQAVEELIVQWAREGKAKGYVANAGSILRRFAADHPKARFGQLTPAEILGWVLKQSPGVRVPAKARISALYSFAVLNGWATKNPCTLFKLPRQSRKQVVVPRAEEIQNFLRAVEEDVWSDLLSYLVLRLFAGLRGEEAARLEWRHIDFNRAKVIVPDGIAAKNGPAREVPISENLAVWLRYSQPEPAEGRIAPENVRQREAEFRKANGFIGPKWFNALRHSFGSYRYPLIENFDRLAGEMGNSRRVLSSHYVGAVVPDDVAIFWAIVPGSRTLPVDCERQKSG